MGMRVAHNKELWNMMASLTGAVLAITWMCGWTVASPVRAEC